MTASAIGALALILVVAPLLPALAGRTVAFLTGRRGAPLLQPYRDLAKLLGKGAVYSRTTTGVFRLAPAVVLGAALVAAGLLPLDGRRGLAGFGGDMIAFAGLLALGRLLLALAGLDTGSSFEGMGASRELGFATFSEPALFLVLGALALATGESSLGGMLGAPLARAWARAPATLAMVGVSLGIVLLAEASRGPVDDPATHLELTMIHEVTILDHGGPDLGILLYGSALKFALFAALLAGTFLPRAAWPAPLAVAALLPALALVAILVGVIESAMARLRLVQVPHLLTGAAALAALGVVLRVR
ncbi:MAG: hydrogenase [Candidatus Eisenbacteria bacterium]|uniref:Hydrogenase n=1 Tax=Eiseniibacteriota bacterium TaxID=2212470 RepID=A0A538UAJ8_UNCEI|nr:MAG: hydrogenase [Candidatus Eisenbacteria bacterium]